MFTQMTEKDLIAIGITSFGAKKILLQVKQGKILFFIFSQLINNNIIFFSVLRASNLPEDTERMDWTDISRFRLQYDF
jgi:hypothetical protein